MRSLCTTSRSDSSRATAQGRSRFHVWRHTFTPRSDLPERRAEVAPEAQSDHTRATGRSRSRFHHPETRERARSDLSQRHSEVAPEAWSDLSERRAEVAPCFVSARTCDFSRAFWSFHYARFYFLNLCFITLSILDHPRSNPYAHEFSFPLVKKEDPLAVNEVEGLEGQEELCFINNNGSWYKKEPNFQYNNYQQKSYPNNQQSGYPPRNNQQGSYQPQQNPSSGSSAPQESSTDTLLKQILESQTRSEKQVGYELKNLHSKIDGSYNELNNKFSHLASTSDLWTSTAGATSRSDGMRSLCTTSRSDSSRATAQGRSRFHVWRHTFTPRSDLPERRAEVAPEAQSDHTRATGRSRSRFHHPETRERARSDLSQRHSEVAPEAWSDLSERRAEVAPCFVSARTFSQTLFEEFSCVPTFIPQDVHRKFYLGFCKQQLWPLFHYMLPMCPDHGERFDRSLWQAYVSANKIFADKVMRVINLEEDYIWIHDYHLMLLPTFLRRRFHRVKLGFFLQPIPFFRNLSNLTCSRGATKGAPKLMLGLEYESKRGHIALDYLGRTVFLKILPIGIQMGRLESVLNLPATAEKLKEIQEKYRGKKVILGVDDMDIFKGLSLKILAVEHLLQQYPSMQGKLVLIQIVNPARGSGKDVQEAKKETYYNVNRINERYGLPGYEPVVLIDRPVPRFEKSAYYAMAECCIVNAVRDGMNLIPYKYTVCRQGTPEMDKSLGVSEDSPRTSTLVLSEFIGCSPSLSDAIRVNPWDVDAVADSMYSAITMSDFEKQLRHKKHYHYISTHDVAYWSRSFTQDLERACRDHYSKRCWGVGWGLGFRLIALSPNFRRLSNEQSVSAYRRSSKRAIFLDYDGTLVPEASIGVSKGLVTGKVLSRMHEEGNAPDFVVCIGDDRSDEEMFESIATTLSAQSSSVSAEIFVCMVGRKPSKAKYFLDEVSDVVKLLQGLANTSSSPKPRYPSHLRVSFESVV
ncbi:hypothetical protein IGI04_014020 [Brassica rapa subsp. trilocularis]|uniref:Uncharacterized protein n=1 Tax=Brassica rapa subsp. trilocularis TaxID=1813537 RepID=A0ABQ7NCK9_BRACM|nr:hypothetical protein IGI04_014020 [Brassica rapa subsp. trilocularis]